MLQVSYARPSDLSQSSSVHDVANGAVGFAVAVAQMEEGMGVSVV